MNQVLGFLKKFNFQPPESVFYFQMPHLIAVKVVYDVKDNILGWHVLQSPGSLLTVLPCCLMMIMDTSHS